MQARGCEVAVVGAGLIGSSIAWRAAQRGARVTLFDAGSMGGEASSAGAGMLAPGGEFEAGSPWARFAVESLRDYAAFVEELSAESGASIDYRACGALEFARTEDEWEKLTQRADAQKLLGIRSEETREGAVFYPDEAIVDPVDVMRALRAICPRNGITLREHDPVRAIRPSHNSVQLALEGAEFQADYAVVAAGAWAGAITVEGAAMPASFPVKGHLVGFDLPPGTLGPILRHGHTYLLQRSGGFTIAGGSSEQVGFNREIRQEIVNDIVARTRELAHKLPLGRPVRSWIGFRPGIEACEPEVRRLGETNVWAAYGHYRNGILLAPITARMVAAEILR